MNALKLYRKRIIPDECILLKDDEVLYADKEVIVSRWHTIRPKKTLHHGYSCYFIERGYKVSKFYDHEGKLVSWYCDIVTSDYNAAENAYTFTDLLVDVIVYPDGHVRVVDLDEMADALRDKLISSENLQKGLRHLDKLLSIIYSGHFDKLQRYIEEYETEDTSWAL